MLLLTSMAIAQSVFLWTDEDGIQHLSDQKPIGDYVVIEQRAIAEPESPVRMDDIGRQGQPVWRFANRLHGPVTIEVVASESLNMISEPELPAWIEIAARGVEMVTLAPDDWQRSWQYRLETAVVPGSVNPDYSADYAYRIPLADDQSARIGQAFNGKFSHQTPGSRFAIDLGLQAGTPIYAARAGVVMDMARYFHQSGENLEHYGPRANFIRILHDDGSMAVYAHLDYDGILVREGQTVERGQKIGLSGNTGYSTGPHLHFAVQINQNMQLISVPFVFASPENRAFTPQQGMQLQGPY
ncbi:MAG: M23 family metallopeptidase [Pseudomonadota bacterium]